MIAYFGISQNSETRQLRNFNELDVSAGIKVTLVAASKTYAEVTVSKTDLDDLITEVDGGELTIKWKSNNWGSYKNNRKGSVTLYYTELNEIEASSGSSVKSENTISSNSFSIDASSGSAIDISLDVSALEVDASSGCNVTVSGSANELDVDASSGSYCGLKELKSKIANANASSGAAIKLYVTESFTADVSSGASIRYDGNPKHTALDDDKWSGGSIRKI